MAEVSVGSVELFADPGRKLVDIDGVEIGVFRFQGEFTAFENVCPHLAGPACAGLMVPRATEAVQADGASQGRMFAPNSMNVTCPWHGYEFDIRTGQHPTLKRVRLRAVPVRVADGEVFVTLPVHRRPVLPEAGLTMAE